MAGPLVCRLTGANRKQLDDFPNGAFDPQRKIRSARGDTIWVDRNVARGLLLVCMKTAKKYLELAERYRSAKLDTKDQTARYLLETLERSYTVLAQSTVVLSRSRKVQKALTRLHQ